MKRRFGQVMTGLFVLLCALAVLCLVKGEAETVSPVEAVRVLVRQLPVVGVGVAPPAAPYTEAIVLSRVPRALAAALIGVALAAAGVAFQSFLMNPLADPYTVGVSSGAALGAAAVALLGGSGWLVGFAQPAAAFFCGLAATAAVYALALRGGRVSAQTFLLSGVVVGAFLWNLIPLALSLANRSGNLDRRTEILRVLLGSLQFIGWREVGLLLPFAIVGTLALWLGARELNLMAQGEETAARLGVDTEQFKRRVVVAGSLATAAAVSVAGIIAFVGLIVPHMARRLVGPDHRRLLPAAALLGGVTLLGADLLTRLIPGQLEIGVVTSLVGAPAFCVLLRRQGKIATG